MEKQYELNLHLFPSLLQRKAQQHQYLELTSVAKIPGLLYKLQAFRIQATVQSFTLNVLSCKTWLTIMYLITYILQINVSNDVSIIDILMILAINKIALFVNY